MMIDAARARVPKGNVPTGPADDSGCETACDAPKGRRSGAPGVDEPSGGLDGLGSDDAHRSFARARAFVGRGAVQVHAEERAHFSFAPRARASISRLSAVRDTLAEAHPAIAAQKHAEHQDSHTA